jgi:hypothetical protein
MSFGKSYKIESCFLVTDRIKVNRAVSYRRFNLKESCKDDGTEEGYWETERVYRNRQETAEAERVYATVRNRLRAICLHTDIGFICPLNKEAELNRIIKEMEELVAESNAKFQFCRVELTVLVTRIESDNAAGVATLSQTLQQSAADIKQALENFDPKTARQVLISTKNIVDVLANQEAKSELMQAREQARSLASAIASLVKNFDGNVQEAMASGDGVNLLARAKSAPWNF